MADQMTEEQVRKEEERLVELAKKDKREEAEEKELQTLKENKQTRFQKRVDKLTWEKKTAEEKGKKKIKEKVGEDEIKDENKDGIEDKKEESEKEEKVITLPEAENLKINEDAQKYKEYWDKECRDKILRLQADLDNTRKRLDKEKQDFVKFANEGIIVELLNVLDDLERAVDLTEAKHQDLPAFLKGIEMILAHLYELLKDYGVTPIEAEGKIFDPNFHEALMQVENKDFPEHTVIEELQKGYRMNDRVIRTSKVKVSKKSVN